MSVVPLGPVMRMALRGWGRPAIRLAGEIGEILSEATVHVSLTHDGDTAAAVAILIAGLGGDGNFADNLVDTWNTIALTVRGWFDGWTS